MSDLRRRQFLASSGLLAGGLTLAAAESPALPAARFRLGLVTYNVAAGWDVPTLIRVCKAVGLEAVELRTTHKHGVEPTLSKERRRDVRKQFADNGLPIWGCGTVCEFHALDQEIVRKNIETCKRFVELVADLGGRGVKVRPNALPAQVPEEQTLRQIGKALTECGKAAADAGVEIHVEVHGAKTADPARMRKIMEEANHPAVGITWNSNREDVVRGSAAPSFRLLAPWLKSCHINLLYEDGRGYPYRELFRLFRQTGYDRVTLIELGKPMLEPEAGIEFLRYYKALWTYLIQS